MMMMTKRALRIARRLCVNKHKYLYRKTYSTDTNATISLNAKDRDILDVLKWVTARTNTNVTLRVVGGWVRDKLLGVPSSDMDLTVDKMTGGEFARRMRAQLRIHKRNDMKFITIKSNPSQSKHLETVVCTYGSSNIDIAHLRSEEYGHTSRIPSVTVGTLIQDARRRDFTINALYYNLNTNEIEDPTGCGLSDLHHRILSTPSDPQRTFLDDPLRMLRAARFMTQLHTFGFALTDECFEAMRLNACTNALRNKVSKERVGIELKKIVEHRDFIVGMSTLYECNIFPVIYPLRTSKSADDACIKRLNILNEVVQEHVSSLSAQQLQTLVTCCFVYERGYSSSKLQQHRTLHDLFRWPKSVSKDVVNIVSMLDKTTLSVFDDEETMKQSIETQWYSILNNISYLLHKDTLELWCMLHVTLAVSSSTTMAATSSNAIDVYGRFINALKHCGLMDIFNVKALVNGNDLGSTGVAIHGYEYKEAILWCLSQQLRQPNIDRETLLKRFVDSWTRTK